MGQVKREAEAAGMFDAPRPERPVHIGVNSHEYQSWSTKDQDRYGEAHMRELQDYWDEIGHDWRDPKDCTS